MALNRYVDVLINNKDCKATLKEPLVVFEKDKNAHIYFRLVDYRYQYKLVQATEEDWSIVYNLNGADAWITIVKPDGTEVEQGKEGNTVNNVILKDAYVRFILSPELTDEITEIGTYQLQIHITDKEGGEVTIPSFSFEVKERLKGTSPASTVLLLTEEGNNLTTEQGTHMVASGSGVTISSLPGRDTCSGSEYMAVAFNGITYKMPASLLKGKDGVNGSNGKEIELQKSDTHIQWRYVGETSWKNLIAISEITGPAGADGTNGTNGQDGATFTPAVSASGDLSWTNNKGLSNPNTVNIKGPKGDTGANGQDGAPGANGTFDKTTQFPELTTTAKDIPGAINENASEIAEITQQVNNHITNHPGGGSDITSRINSQKWLVIGDSISLISSSHTQKNYSAFISERTGCTISNWGKDGYTIVRYIEEEQVSQMPTDVDFISVLLGTNDWHIGTKPLGDFLDTTSETVAGAVNLLLQQLIQKYGDRTIIVFTPLQRNGYGGNQSGLNASNNGQGFNLLALVDIIIKTCQHYGIPYKDLYRGSGFHMQYDISKNLYFSDGLHPNIKGHEALSYIIQPFIEDNFKPNPNSTPQTYGQIVLSKTTTTIAEGKTDTFTVKLDKAPTNNQIVTLSKNNADVTLNPTSLIFTPTNYNTAQTVTITVAEDNTDYNNETCTITLSSPNVTTKTLVATIADNDTPPTNIPVTGVTLDKNAHTFKVNETVQLTATIQPTDATNRAVTWSSSDTNKATVTSNGLVTAKAEGLATITVTTTDGSKTATCNLTIQAKAVEPTGYNVKVTGYGDFTPDQTAKTCIVRDSSTSWNNGGIACNDNLVNGKSYNLGIEILEIDIKGTIKASAGSNGGLWTNLDTSDWKTWLQTATVGSKKVYTGTLAKNTTSADNLLVLYFEGSNTGSSFKTKFTITDAV